MDANINPVSGTSQHYTPVLKASTDSVPPSAPQAQAAAQTLTSDPISTAPAASSDQEQQYEAAIRQAALSFKNVYAISDQDFSIFKDATGKYITRYVSLRDGKVTYLPEPTLVKQVQQSSGNTPALLAISA